MPIKIPNELPAVKTLSEENIFVMTETRAMTQDIRPLKLLLLNLMPLKIDTETQLSRLLGNTPLQIELEFICTKTHNSKNTPQSHLQTFYKPLPSIWFLNAFLIAAFAALMFFMLFTATLSRYVAPSS